MKNIVTSLALLLCLHGAIAQKKPASTTPAPSTEDIALSGLRFRNIGPALTSGRIAGLAKDPAK